MQSSPAPTDSTAAIAAIAAIPLPTESVDHVRDAFRAWVNGATTTGQLRRGLRVFCEEARAQQMRPEEMLVAFKAVCRSVPEVCGPRTVPAPLDLVGRAVTICIEEFYQVPDPRPRCADAPGA